MTNTKISLNTFKSYLFPFVYFVKGKNGHDIVRLKHECYIKDHVKEFDDFLISHGFCKDNDYVDFKRTGEAIIPDYSYFCTYIEDTVNSISKKTGQIRATHIIRFVKTELYDSAGEGRSLFDMAWVLCQILSEVLDIRYLKDDIGPQICIEGIKANVYEDRADEWDEMLQELGLTLFDPWEPAEAFFEESVKDYINNAGYLNDGFTWGYEILRCYYNNKFCA